jgi:hypothetical protein
MNIKVIIPLIAKGELLGFVALSEKNSINEYSEDEYNILETLKSLVNSAIENYKSYEELKLINSQLDEKIFNLFAINQSSKALLSELDIEKLYSLAVDVFSELTQSAVTSFIVFDEISEKYVIRAYRNVLSPNEHFDILIRHNKDTKTDTSKVILNVESDEDMNYLMSIFPNYDEIIVSLKVRFFILLFRNNQIYGMVTMGENLLGIDYKASIFELVESLASSTYIAVLNAILFKEVNMQKDLINSKLERLITLNSLIKNVNSSKNIQTMSDLVLETLNVHFKVEKAIFGIYNSNKNCFDIMGSVGIKAIDTEIPILDEWKKAFEGDVIFEYSQQAGNKYFSSEFLQQIGDISGILISPISILDIEKQKLLGVLIILKTEQSLINDEENIVTFVTISNHIAPIISNFKNMDEYSKLCVPNYEEVFLKELDTQIEQTKEFNSYLEVINIKLNDKFSFNSTNVGFKDLQKEYEKIYQVSCDNIFIISDFENEDAEYIIRRQLDTELELNKYVFKEHFNSLEEFKNLF